MATEPSDAGQSHVDDAHRDAAIDALRTAAGDGLIDLEEFGDRAGVVYAADRLDEVRAVLDDLPGADVPALSPMPPAHADLPPPPPPPPRETQYVVAVMSGADRRGTWRAKGQINAVAIMGGCTLDFRHAELSARVTRVSAMAIMGGIDVVVPEGVPVEVDGFVLMGAVENKTRTTAAPGMPMVKVTAYGLMGGVTVRHPRRRKGNRPQPSTTTPTLEPPPPVPAAPPTPASPTPLPPDGATVTLLRTHIVDSAAKAQSLGDRRWFEVLRAHNAAVAEHVEAHGGRAVKSYTDGSMVSFTSARQAVRCAIAIQRALVSHRLGDPHTDLHVQIGLHSGEVIAADGDLFGRNVELASRIAAEAGTDDIVASAVTKQLADAGGDLHFGAGRPTELRGLSGEWALHEVKWS